MRASIPVAPMRDPFLLPVCDCGGPMNLASVEPHPTESGQDLKTFKCRHCGKQQAFVVRRREPRVDIE